MANLFEKLAQAPSRLEKGEQVWDEKPENIPEGYSGEVPQPIIPLKPIAGRIPQKNSSSAG